MAIATSRKALACTLIVALVGVAPGLAGAGTQGVGVDPAATKILQRMTDYLGGLKHFSVHTQNTMEDVLDSGQRIDTDISARLSLSRPDKLRAERKGGRLDQEFYYDGKELTLYSPTDKVYATVPAPNTIGGMLDFSRESLGLVIPAADLLYPNAFALLTEGLTSGILVGKAEIGGRKCDHLAFSRPGVDFQVWVAEGHEPLPCKYVVTDTGNPGHLSISTVMSDWSLKHAPHHARFTFSAPKGAKAIEFMRLDAGSASSQ